MDAYGALTTYVGALIAEGRLPRLRVALVAAGPRNKRYAANPAYARALATRLVPALRDAVGRRGRPVLMGQSLGALAALHAAWTDPGASPGCSCRAAPTSPPTSTRRSPASSSGPR